MTKVVCTTLRSPSIGDLGRVGVDYAAVFTESQPGLLRVKKEGGMDSDQSSRTASHAPVGMQHTASTVASSLTSRQRTPTG